MRQQRQIITLEVKFDPGQCPPPEQWNWVEVSADIAGVEINVLASGAVEQIPTKTPA